MKRKNGSSFFKKGKHQEKQGRSEFLTNSFSDLDFQKKERQQATLLRSSHWWKRKLNETKTCYYCQKPLLAEEKTMDHKIPLSRWGKSVKGNLVVCCKNCNTEKGSKNLLDWNVVSSSSRVIQKDH